MGKALYIGIGGAARKMKKAYIGIGGAARRVKKIYIGVGGTARLCYSYSALSYLGTVSGLSYERSGLAGAAAGNYAVFVGGNYTGGIDIYNSALARSTGSSLWTLYDGMAAATLYGYAFFGGGSYAGEEEAYPNAKVIAFDNSLTRRSLADLNSGEDGIAAATTPYYVIFPSSGGNGTYYNTSMVKGTAGGLSIPRGRFAAASIGAYALFAGGYYNGESAAVDAYDSSMVRTSPAALSVARSELGGTGNGTYAIFAGGGKWGTTMRNAVDAYDASLVRSTPAVLSCERTRPQAVSVGGVAVISGGYNGGARSEVDMYDSSLVRTTGTGAARYNGASAVAGSFAIIAGGKNSSGADTATAEAYSV